MCSVFGDPKSSICLQSAIILYFFEDLSCIFVFDSWSKATQSQKKCSVGSEFPQLFSRIFMDVYWYKTRDCVRRTGQTPLWNYPKAFWTVLLKIVCLTVRYHVAKGWNEKSIAVFYIAYLLRALNTYYLECITVYISSIRSLQSTLQVSRWCTQNGQKIECGPLWSSSCWRIRSGACFVKKRRWNSPFKSTSADFNSNKIEERLET